MQTSYNHNKVWKIAVPIVAIAIAIGAAIYAGGFENFLKFIGIKASQVQTISISSNLELLGDSSAGEWVVVDEPAYFEGVSVLSSYSSIPADYGTEGLVMPIFDSADERQNSYPTHVYRTTAIDLGGEDILIDSITVQQYQAPGAQILHSYRSASTLAELTNHTFTPLELAGSEDQQTEDTVQLGVPVQQYFQLETTFIGDTFATRSAVYGYSINYTGSERESTTQTVTDTPVVTRPFTATLDFTPARQLPDVVSIQILDVSLGVQPIYELKSVPSEQLVPLHQLNKELYAGSYVAVIRGGGVEAQAIPFIISNANKTIDITTFTPTTSEVNFDLNQDGIINSLDLGLLLGKIGSSTTPTDSTPLTE